MRRDTRRLAAFLLVLVALGLLTPAPAADASEPVALATITLTTVEPALPSPDGEITLKGRVTNTTDERIERPQAIFWRNQAPITDAEGLATALGSDSNDPIGARYTSVFQNLYDPAQPYLDPGKSASFSLTAQVRDLALAPTDGVFLLGVHVLPATGEPAIARTRVLVPVLRAEPAQKSQVASVVVLSSRPSQLAPGLLVDDHLAGELAPTGRLTRLVRTALADEDSSFAVDPALVAEATTMRAGYQVRATDGTTTAGTGQADATRWLTELGRLVAERDGYRLLYGSPDVAALAHARQTAVLQAAARAGKDVTLTSALPLLVLPTNGAADEATVQAAEQLDPRAILLADSTTGGTGPLLTASGSAPLVTYTSSALGGGPGPDPSDDAVHIRQRTLATSWVDATTSDQPQARVRLVRSAAQAASTQATAVQGDDDPPWVAPVTLSTVLDRTPAAWDDDYVYPASAAGEELNAGQLSTLDRFVDAQQTWQDLLVDSRAESALGDAAIARAASGAWRGRGTARNAFLQPQQESLDVRLTDKVRISSTRKVSTVDQQGVEFPITIRNELDRAGDGSRTDPNAIHVRLGFASDNRSRLQIKPITAQAIPPADSFTANAEVAARANGTVPVLAQLYTESGRKVGRPVEIEVQVTQNGTTGWAIVIAASVVLVASTSFRIRQVAKERARQAALETFGEQSASEPPVSALTSAPPVEVGPDGRDVPASEPDR